MMGTGYFPAFYGIFLGHEHRKIVGEGNIVGPQARMVRQGVRDDTDAQRLQQIEKALRIADGGHRVHRAAREFAQGLGRPVPQGNRAAFSRRMRNAPASDA